MDYASLSEHLTSEEHERARKVLEKFLSFKEFGGEGRPEILLYLTLKECELFERAFMYEGETIPSNAIYDLYRRFCVWVRCGLLRTKKGLFSKTYRPVMPTLTGGHLFNLDVTCTPTIKVNTGKNQKRLATSTVNLDRAILECIIANAATWKLPNMFFVWDDWPNEKSIFVTSMREVTFDERWAHIACHLKKNEGLMVRPRGV